MSSDRMFPALCSKVRSALNSVGPSDREIAIKEVRRVIDEAMFGLCEIGPSDTACPKCGSSKLVRNGHTRKGTQRLLCKRCGKVFAQPIGGRIIINTKLDRSVWMKFAECFVDRLTVDECAKRCEVSHKTAWFMRVRTMEAVKDLLPSFEMKSGSGIQLDEFYVRDSLKGTRLEGIENAPRKPHKRGMQAKSGISDDQICVITGLNDNRDFFYEVSCRGPMTCEVAETVLKNKMCEGAVVNTDRHRSYGSVLRDLGVAIHNAYSSHDHGPMNRINALHSGIRAFLGRFKGVSTKWLHGYLGWFKWMMSFGDGMNPREKVMARQISEGDYMHTWRSIPGMPIPFRDSDLNPVKLRSSAFKSSCRPASSTAAASRPLHVRRGLDRTAKRQ